jgi:hypothetical protein
MPTKVSDKNIAAVTLIDPIKISVVFISPLAKKNVFFLIITRSD